MNHQKKDGKFCRLFHFSGCQSTVSVLDELVEAVPGVVVLMHLKIVVEDLVNGFDARFDSIVARWEKV